MVQSQASAEDIVACQQVIARLAVLLDHDGLDRLDELFASDAVVSLFGTEVAGIDAIRALFRSRTEGVVIRHALSPSQVDLISADSARAVTYVTVYRAPQTGVAGPAPLTGPVNLVEYEDQLVRTRGAWRIAKREIRMIFKAP